MVDVGDRDAFIIKADRLLAQEAFEEALDLAQERLKASPYDFEAVMVVCQSWIGLHRLAEAEKALAMLEPVHVRMASLYRSLGDACLKEDRKRDAVFYFQKGLALLPEAYASPGLSHMMEDATGALEAGVSVHESRRGNASADTDFYTMTMADLYVKQGHLQSAVEVLDGIRKREPDNADVVRRLRDVKALMADQSATPPETPHSAVVTELSRWLKNIDRIRSHGRPSPRHA